MVGNLYFVGTPIGNLEDITLRALRILKEVDFIASEDTRVALKLLNHFEIKKKLISYEKFSEESKKTYILDLVEEGNNVALISDAGMPGISDPGEILMKEAYIRGINPIVIPGPSAVISAAVVSGLDTDRFFFQGFLPKGKNKDRVKILKELEKIEAPLIFYVSPHSLSKDLSDIIQILGNRKATLARELTKYYEEIIRDDIEGMIDLLTKRTLKGEMVLVVEGYSGVEGEIPIEDQYEFYLKVMTEKGLKTKEAIKEVVSALGGNKNKLYEYILSQKEDKE